MSIYKKILLCVLLPLAILGMKPIVTQEVEIVNPTFEQEITRIFGAKAEIALAVFEHESNNNLNAINYNCYYYNSKGKRYSTFCKKKDIVKAWSVDCGVAQVNVKGKTCPPQLLTKEGSIPYIEKIYKEQGLKAWVSFKSNKYKKYM